MCGRYFWNDDAEEAFAEDFPQLAGKVGKLRTGDYTPNMNVAAVTAGVEFREDFAAADAAGGSSKGDAGASLNIELMLWGFHGFDKGKLLINARAESVKDKPTFADSFAQRRCVLPAAGFYEWDQKKEKVIFTLPDKPVLYLAGIYRLYGQERRFVVLTREANASMAPVHDRMPLILSEDEVESWVCDRRAADDLLAKKLPVMHARRPYEQISFDW